MNQFVAGEGNLEDVTKFIRSFHSCPDGSLEQVVAFFKETVSMAQLSVDTFDAYWTRQELVAESYPLDSFGLNIFIQMYLKYSGTPEFTNFLSSFAPYNPGEKPLNKANFREWMIKRINSTPAEVHRKRGAAMARSDQLLTALLENRGRLPIKLPGDESVKDSGKHTGDNGDEKSDFKGKHKRRSERCPTCKIRDRTADKCYEKDKILGNQTGDSKPESKPSVNLVGTPISKPVEVLLDNCSSLHILNDCSLFDGPNRDSQDTYRVSGGLSKVKGVGSATIKLRTLSGDIVHWKLKDVYYTPDSANLLSAGLLQRGHQAIVKRISNNVLGVDGTACIENLDSTSYEIDLQLGTNGHPCLPVVGFGSGSVYTTVDGNTGSSQDSASRENDFSGLSLSTRMDSTASFGASIYVVSAEVCGADNGAGLAHTIPQATIKRSELASGDEGGPVADSNQCVTAETYDTVRGTVYPDLFGDSASGVYAVDKAKRVIATMDDVRTLHIQLGHASKNVMRGSASRLGYYVTGAASKMMKPGVLACNACRASKVVNSGVSSVSQVRGTSVNQTLTFDHLKVLCPSIIDQTTSALVVVDDYSRYCWVYPGERSEAPACVVHRIWNNYHLGHGIPATLCTDEAFEFDSIDAPVFTKLGINHHTAATRHHESVVGTVERKVQTLKWNMSALLYQCRLPHMFWPFALKHANWLLNWLPSNASHLKGQCPAEVFRDKQPLHLQFTAPFGCDISFHSGTGDTNKNQLVQDFSFTIEFKGTERPKPRRPYRIDSETETLLRSTLRDDVLNGKIKPSSSPYAAPCFFVPKKPNSKRMVIDYRSLNAVTVPDAYPLPRTDDVIDRLSRGKVFTTLDLQSGYQQSSTSTPSHIPAGYREGNFNRHKHILHGVFLGMSWNQFDSTALIFVLSKQRFQAVPFSKLNLFPETFTISSYL